MRYADEDNRAPMPAPDTDDRDPAGLVPAAVDEVLRTAQEWLGWNGTAVRAQGNAWTPHKVLRRVTDHLVEHLAEIDARLAGVPPLPDGWHGRRLTLDSDWARFTEADLDEAESRLRRLALCYRVRLSGLDDAALDAGSDGGEWTLRQVVVHVANATASYAGAMAGM